MADEVYTLILVPGARSVSRKIRVSARTVGWGLRAGVALGLATVALLVHYVWLNGRVSAMAALRSENAALSERVRQYSEAIGQLEGRVASLHRTVAKLGVMSGVEQVLPDLGGAAGGVGGAGIDSTPPSRDPDVVARSLSRRLADLAGRATRIEAFYEDQTALLSGTPSIWPVRGYLASGFGNRLDPFTGRPDFHPGIDVSAPRGTKILAPADGVVLAVGHRGAYGNAIIVDHGRDVITRYGHLDGYDVRPGQRVHRGEVIGSVGSSGRSNAPHLHYEVWLGDRPQNPIHYILDEYRSFG